MSPLCESRFLFLRLWRITGLKLFRQDENLHVSEKYREMLVWLFKWNVRYSRRKGILTRAENYPKADASSNATRGFLLAARKLVLRSDVYSILGYLTQGKLREISHQPTKVGWNVAASENPIASPRLLLSSRDEPLRLASLGCFRLFRAVSLRGKQVREPLASIPRDVTEAPPPRDPVFLILSVYQNRRALKKRVCKQRTTLCGYQSSLRSVVIYEHETVFSHWFLTELTVQSLTV